MVSTAGHGKGISQRVGTPLPAGGPRTEDSWRAEAQSADPQPVVKLPKPAKRHVQQSASLPSIQSVREFHACASILVLTPIFFLESIPKRPASCSALPSPPYSIMSDSSPSAFHDMSLHRATAATDALSQHIASPHAHHVHGGDGTNNKVLMTPPLTPSSTVRTTSIGSTYTDEDVEEVLPEGANNMTRIVVAPGSGGRDDASHEQHFVDVRWKFGPGDYASETKASSTPLVTPRGPSDLPPSFVPRQLSASSSASFIPQARAGGPKPFIPNQHFMSPPVERYDNAQVADAGYTMLSHPNAGDLRAFMHPCFQQAPEHSSFSPPIPQQQQQQQHPIFYQGVPMSPQLQHASIYYPSHPAQYVPTGVHCAPGSPPMQFDQPRPFMMPPMHYGQPIQYFGGYSHGIPGPGPMPEQAPFWDVTPPAPMMQPPMGFIPDDILYNPAHPHAPKAPYPFSDEGLLHEGAEGKRRTSPPRGLRRKHGPNSRSRDPGVTAEHNQLNLDRIEQGLDTRTTVMIKNIPNKMKDTCLEEFIAKVCPRKIDFMYLRVDFSNGCNVGYACVNFIDVKDLLYFAKSCLGKKWGLCHSEKVLHMCYANYQGKEALVEKFKNSGIMEMKEEWRPRIYHSSGPNQGLSEEFPRPTHLRRKERSSLNRTLYTPIEGSGLDTAPGFRRGMRLLTTPHAMDVTVD
ncbi:RNA recognition motif 2-domain-containing protein [Schizophyllum amplum]|uniref:RNA recognition motif 2-domain-containing protein n=1 Tax=Schizophyllum amplum TaxID=97359 RepID=A0A550CX37_9AGAR|nr:RNA recognition motif 2-domain-containing protein [Auriculariopsis ampla]